MEEFEGLIKEIENSVDRFGYITDDSFTLPDVKLISYIVKPQPFKVRNLCAVIDVPIDIVDYDIAKRFFQFIRTSLLEKYGDAFLWKELEICFVVLCHEYLYEKMKSSDGTAVDQASFSMNAMLGTCFINEETFDNFARHSWGLYFSGDHFKAIKNTVEMWCESKKNGENVSTDVS